MRTDEATFFLEIICPNQIFYEGQVFMIEFDTLEGPVGIYKNHIPEVFVLGPGVGEITLDSKKIKVSFGKGFAKVSNNQVTILTEKAQWMGTVIS